VHLCNIKKCNLTELFAEVKDHIDSKQYLYNSFLVFFSGVTPDKVKFEMHALGIMTAGFFDNKQYQSTDRNSMH